MPSAKTTSELGKLIFDLLGNCQLPITHNGTVNLPNIVNNFSGGASYAVANATWVRQSGHGSTVTALPASDPTGTPSGAGAITIYLPRWNAAKDPNVYSGDILQYVTVNGVNYAVGDYLDDRIGTIKYQHHATIPHGWEAYSDCYGKFIQGASAAAAGGGTSSHTHTGTVTVDEASADIQGTSLTVSSLVGSTGTTSLATLGSSGTTGTTSLSTGSASGTSGSSTTGITVGDHADHKHSQDAPCQALADAMGPFCHNSPTTNYTSGALDASTGSPMTLTHSVTDPGHTHTFGSHTHSISPDPHDHSIGSHTHAVDPNPHSHDMGHGHTISSNPHTHTDAGHTHTATVDIDETSHLPPYIVEVPIIRVGPSGEYS